MDKRTLGIHTKVFKRQNNALVFIGSFQTIKDASKSANITEEGVHYILKHTRKNIEKYTLSGYTFFTERTRFN